MGEVSLAAGVCTIATSPKLEEVIAPVETEFESWAGRNCAVSINGPGRPVTAARNNS